MKRLTSGPLSGCLLSLALLLQGCAAYSQENVATAPVLSINRGFSAPVIVDTNRSQADLAFLSAHDDDPFARYEAMQQLMVNVLVGRIGGQAADEGAVIDAIRQTLTNPALDPAFVAEAIRLPSEAYLGDQMPIVDPDAIHNARNALQHRIGAELQPLWRDMHARLRANSFSLSPAAKGARKLRNAALHYLVASGAADGPLTAFEQFDSADNMTERQAALGILANGESPERIAALDIFYNRYCADALTLDKWFQTQAFAFHPDTVDLVEELGVESCDLLFIDAIKTEYPGYLEAGFPLVRSGGLIVADNVLGAGKGWVPGSIDEEPSRVAIDNFNKMVSEHPRMQGTILPMRQGLLVAQVR